MAGITQNKQKALFSLWSLNKNSRNVVVSRGENMVIIILAKVTKLTKIKMIRTVTVVIIIIILLLLIIKINNYINNNGNYYYYFIQQSRKQDSLGHLLKSSANM